ncbi:MAG: hypothetical protein ACFFDF_07210 [Candidatus Odinarchaeota archaeon]
MNSNSKPEENSKVNEIPDAEMKKRYQKSLAISIVGIILLIIGIILLFIGLGGFWLVYFGGLHWGGGFTFYLMINFMTLGIILIIIGLILVITGLKIRRKKKFSRFLISRAVLIVGITIIFFCAIAAIWLYLTILPGILLGIIISLCGFYGIKVNKSQLDSQKRKILKKYYSGLITLILGIIFLIPAGYLWWSCIAYGISGMAGLALIGAGFCTIIGTILMVLGLVRVISYRSERKKISS